MTSRRTLVLAVSVCALAAGLSACRGRGAGSGGTATTSIPHATAAYMNAYTGVATRTAPGEDLLRRLPWSPDVQRADLGANGPVALTGLYLMRSDVLAVDSTGRLVALSRRDLNPKWVSTLTHPVAFAPTESPTHYVFVEKDNRGAYWIEAFSRRTGAPSDGSPIRIPFSASSGAGAIASTAYVGSLGSPRDNKTFESVNLTDGSIGWGVRTAGRIVGTPQVTEAGEAVIVVSEDGSVMALPANPSTTPIPGPLWEAKTFAANYAAPTLTKDLMFLGSDDNLVRGFDVHSGRILWLKGVDAPVRRAPWTLGTQVARSVAPTAEGASATAVETFEGYVFVKNEVGLHAFEALSGDEVFKDPTAMRPVAKAGEWVVTLTDDRGAQLRRGKGLPVVQMADFRVFDFVLTNATDGTIYVGSGDGTILAASPK